MATPFESYTQRGKEALAQKKDQASQESSEAKTAAYSRYRRLGQETLNEREKVKEERERRAARGATKTSSGVLWGGAGAAIGGGFWTLGQVLQYSLIGWTLDANGVPRKDAVALKAFEEAYTATKGGSVLGGIAKGLGMAA